MVCFPVSSLQGSCKPKTRSKPIDAHTGVAFCSTAPAQTSADFANRSHSLELQLLGPKAVSERSRCAPGKPTCKFECSQLVLPSERELAPSSSSSLRTERSLRLSISEEEGEEEEAIEANERCDSMSTALSELQGDRPTPQVDAGRTFPQLRPAVETLSHYSLTASAVLLETEEAKRPTWNPLASGTPSNRYGVQKHVKAVLLRSETLVADTESLRKLCFDTLAAREDTASTLQEVCIACL